VTLQTLVNVPLFVALQVRGLAAGHALSYLFGVTLLLRALSRRVGGLPFRELFRSALRTGAAAAGMGLVVWSVLGLVTQIVAATTLSGQLLAVAAPVGAGVLTYLGIAYLLHVEELQLASNTVLRRRRLQRPSG
jgi:putative peptidoglycan lipid II flippase